MKYSILILFTMLSFSWASLASQIRCYSNSNAATYRNSTGLWILEATAASDFTLQNVKLKNQRHTKLQSELKSSSYDRRISEARLFKISGDVFCNYEVEVPRNFSKEKSFQAELRMTCDDMYDAQVKMTCVQR